MSAVATSLCHGAGYEWASVADMVSRNEEPREARPSIVLRLWRRDPTIIPTSGCERLGEGGISMRWSVVRDRELVSARSSFPSAYLWCFRWPSEINGLAVAQH